jgi:hypothetical protein
MAKSRKSEPAAVPGERAGVTEERFARFHRLLKYLGSGPKTRERLIKHLRLDVRGFYRDLEVLRSSDIQVALEEGRYRLKEGLASALERLPFPDPRLTLGQARQLAKGRSPAHRVLQEQIKQALA